MVPERGSKISPLRPSSVVSSVEMTTNKRRKIISNTPSVISTGGWNDRSATEEMKAVGVYKSSVELKIEFRGVYRKGNAAHTSCKPQLYLQSHPK